MNITQLKELASTLDQIADGAEWECKWMLEWAHPAGRDLEYCLRNNVPIRIKPKPMEWSIVVSTEKNATYPAGTIDERATCDLQKNMGAPDGDKWKIVRVREIID